MSHTQAIQYFALIGAAGYIAPRHLKAIKETGNELLAALDISDSVGILDNYFPQAHFFTEFERFDRHIDKLKRLPNSKPVNYISICSPNYLHDSHVRFALRSGAHAICEKPVVLNHWNLDALESLENETGKKVFSVLQLRLHPSIMVLKKEVESAPDATKYDVVLTYVTARGKWYFNSWKGNDEKSGGIVSNIGIHFFDMLYYVFGKAINNKVHYKSPSKASGFLEFEKARVQWFLSVDENDLPLPVRQQGKRTYRSLLLNNKEVEFSTGFTDLHTRIYENVIAGAGFGLHTCRPAIELTGNIKLQTPVAPQADYHPFLTKQ